MAFLPSMVLPLITNQVASETGVQCAILSGSSPKASAFQTRPVALTASVAVDPCESSVLDPHFINSCGNSGHSLIRDNTSGGSEP